MKYLTKKVFGQNTQLDSPVENATSKKFKRVTKHAILGLVARILETDEFVAVEDENGHLIGAVTHVHMLNFIAEDAISEKTRKLEI